MTDSTAPSVERGKLAGALLCALAALLAIALYAPTVTGEWVYDDERQIVQNPLIQDPALFGEAMTRDVWSFLGGDEAKSNYWRPTFVLWLIAQQRVFGVADPTPWRIANILLHAGATLLAFALCRRLGVGPMLAGAIACVFAAHPAHVESVAWVSGSPDLLMAIALFGSLIALIGAVEKGGRDRWAIALALYAVAQLAKEPAIVTPAAAFAIGWWKTPEQKGRWRRAALVAAPFAALAIAYFVARAMILGEVSQRPPGAPGLRGVIDSSPLVALFYLRQMVFPLWVGPSYPIRPVQDFGLMTVVIPGAVVTALCLAGLALARRRFDAAVGLALLATLAPAMNIGAFQPEQIVHDRYLYIPVLGLLLLAAPFAASLIARRTDELRARAIVAIALVVACAPLGVQTVLYGRAWMDDLPLWQRAVALDPDSSFNQVQLASYLVPEGRLAEARAALERALEINEVTNAYLGLSEIDMEERRYADAESRLLTVLERQPTNYRAQERLAVLYERWGRLDRAEQSLREARDRIPHARAALTHKLAVILYRQGRRDDALSELESARDAAATEIQPEARMVLLRIGQLRFERGESGPAIAALEAFLASTRSASIPMIEDGRRQARAMLGQLGR